MAKRRSSYRPPTPRFFLANSVVNVRFSYQGTRIAISTQERIDPKDWDAKRHTPKSSQRGRQDLVKLKQRLSGWEAAVISTFRRLGPDFSPQVFKQEVLYEVGAEDRPGDVPKQLLPYLRHFINSYKANKAKTRTSWGKFDSLHTHLNTYVKETGKVLDFNTVDWQFKEDFTEWMYAPPRSFSINNAAKLIATLKHVMRDAARKGVHGNRIIDDPSFGIQRVKTKNKVRLTVDELRTIEHYDFSDQPNLEQVRDLLIYASWTGLRVSDWHKVGRANLRELEGEVYIELATTKTKTKVLIPVVPQVERILDKYNYQLPKLVEQTFNRLVKQVCKLAIPESRFTRVYSEEGQRKEEQAYKHEFVSSHAGRRSFASNLYEATGQAYPIMQITGHSTEAMFHRYIDLKTEDVVRPLHSAAVRLATE
jgi:integrase